MKFTPGQIVTALYEKSDATISARTILPTSVPDTFIRAIDLTEVTDPQKRAEIQQLYAEYREYVAHYMSNMFNFETWVDHTHNDKIDVKWRSFTLDKFK